MRYLLCTYLIICFELAACTPAHLTKLREPASEKSEVIVYRESKFYGYALTLVFGENSADYAQLGAGEYSRVYFAPGKYNFFARSTNADQPYILPVTLDSDKKTCLRAYVNPINFVKILFPPAHFSGNNFLLEQVTCLPDNELSNYSLVKVEYEP